MTNELFDQAIKEHAAQVVIDWRATQGASIHGEVFLNEGVALWVKMPVVTWLQDNYSVADTDWYFSSANLCANPWLWDNGDRAEKVWVSDQVYVHLKLVWS